MCANGITAARVLDVCIYIPLESIDNELFDPHASVTNTNTHTRLRARACYSLERVRGSLCALCGRAKDDASHTSQLCYPTHTSLHSRPVEYGDGST